MALGEDGRRGETGASGDLLLEQWRGKFARASMLAMAVVGSILLIIYHSGLSPFSATTDWILVAVFLAASLIERPPSWLATLMIASVCMQGGVMAVWADHGQALAINLFLLGIVLAAVLSSWRVALLLLAVCTVVLSIGASAELRGIVFSPGAGNLTPPARLAGNVFTFAVTGTLIVISQAFVLQRLRLAQSDRTDALSRQREEAARSAQALQELQTAHAEMQRTQAQLIAAGKSELLGQLAAGVAHDMNNALTVVMGETELIRETDPRSASAIVEAVGHASHLTRQLLALGRKDIVRPEPLALSRSLEQVSEVLKRTLPSDIELVLSVDQEVVVLADGHQIQQVLLNLATNAAHAMPKGGTLEMSVSSDGHRARLVVRDTGVGMNKETQRHIFEPFFSTKTETTGTGLGLASVRAIVDQLGGDISCRSALGRGTEFVVELPLAQGETPVSLALESVRPAEGLSDGEFLVVEDDDNVRAVISSALLSQGASVLEAGDPAAGARKAGQSGKTFDVLCTDVVMPEGGGGEMIDWFGRRYPNAEIVICTGYSDDELLRRDVSKGRYLLLRKPFSRKDLLLICDEALTRARRRRSRGGNVELAPREVGSREWEPDPRREPGLQLSLFDL